MDLSLVLLRAALLAYAAGFACALLPALLRWRGVARLTPWLAAAGVAAHTASFVALGAALGRCPLATVPEIVSALAWAAVGIALVVALRRGLQVLHVIVLPLVVVVMFAAGLPSAQAAPAPPSPDPVLLRLHLTVIVLAVAALFVTFAASLVYVAVDRVLKARRKLRFVLALPSLQQCDAVGRMSLLWAYPLLTLGIVTGVVAVAGSRGGSFGWEPRETLAVLAWAILGVVVAAREGWGWRGRNAALLTIVGFAAVLLRVLGVS
jgi:ABC-type uncharacterized transport system permease subunit